MKRELYGVLGVDKTATTDEVRKAYRKKAVKAHPDAGGDREGWDRLQRAVLVLTNPRARARYDRTGDDDDGGADKLPAFILQTAMQAVQHVIGEATKKGDPAHFDIISDAVRHLQGQVRQQEANKQATRDQIAEIRRIGKRFKAKRGKPNRVGQMFENNARDQERILDQIDEKMEILKGAIGLLTDHTFDWERPEPAYPKRADMAAAFPSFFARLGP